MDRTSFLASLPFLALLPSPAWPPPSNNNSHVVVLAGDHSYGPFQLSIETTNTNTKKNCIANGSRSNSNSSSSSQPSFFAASSQKGPTTAANATTSADPAQTPIELVICSTNSSNNDTCTTITATTEQPDDDETTSTSKLVYLRVDGRVFALNLSALQRLTVVHETYQKDNDDDYGYSINKTIVTPPSLLWEFADCNRCKFRFFRTTGTADDCAEDRAFWTGVRKTLLETARVAIFPEVECASSSASTPSARSSHSTGGGSSSTLSPNAAAAAEAGGSTSINNTKKRAAVTAATETTVDRHDDNDHHSNNINNNDITLRLQRRHKAARECTESLGLIRHILQLPADTVNGSNNSSVSLGPLLTKTADHLRAARLSEQAAHEATRHLHGLQRNLAQQMEAALNFFPVPPKRRQRQHNHHHHPFATAATSNGSSNGNDAPVLSTEDAAKQLESLLEQHKQATAERHKLLLLPSRG